MTSQWNSKAFGKNVDKLQSGLLDETGVILMQGKNPFGDRIYAYLKLSVKDFMRMQEAVKKGEPFNPSDFGSVVAAGKGDPTDEVKAEIASMYRILDSGGGSTAAAAPPPTEKAWDEY